MRPMRLTLLCVLFCALLPGSPPEVTAEQEQSKTRYVSDYLKINLKNRLEKPYEVVATVQTDDAVQLLEESENYWKIATPDGKEGWIAKHYLKNEPPKATIIKQLRQENAELKEQLQALLANPGAKGGENTAGKELVEKLANAEKIIASLQQQLSEAQTASARAVTATLDPGTTSEEHQAWLAEEYEKRGEQLEELQKNLAKKEDRTRFLWFAAGALVFLVGLLAGRTGNRKKNKLIY